MMAVKANLFKKCPHCSFKKCWLKAGTCENCGYDFNKQRAPRRPKKVVDDDYGLDDDVVIPAEILAPPKTVKKVCPGCQKEVFYRAPECEYCEWSFLTNAPKYVTAAVITDTETKHFGVEPCFSSFPVLPFQEEFDGDPADNKTVRHYISAFLRGWQVQYGEEIHPSSVFHWADGYTKNTKIKEARLLLSDIVCPRAGMTIAQLRGKRYYLYHATEEQISAAYKGVR